MATTKTSENICYKTDGIRNYFDGYRDKWEDFYPSEKWAFEKLAGPARDIGHVLDVGCAMGGLGLALSSRFKIKEYVGVDINRQAIDQAGRMRPRFPVPVKFECGDIIKLDKLDGKLFDTVVSLSCADLNINTRGIIDRCWGFVRPGGSFVISVRLTPGQGINAIEKSYQPIARDDQGNILESANYVVFNWLEFFNILKHLVPKPSLMSAYGYWGNPSSNAVTPYQELVFAVFIVRKSKESTFSPKAVNTELFLPLNLFCNDA